MGSSIRYQNSIGGIGAAQLDGFFVGWPNPPSSETHLKLLAGSTYIWLAIEPDEERVVGFITAVSDRILTAYIPLLEILPDFQNQGIGSELVRRMLKTLSHLYAIDLLCDPELQPYYARLGMRPAAGMLLRHYHNQSGGGQSN